MGDFNIELLKHIYHLGTSTYFNNLFSDNMYLIKSEPTRITSKSATCIYTNNLPLS